MRQALLAEADAAPVAERVLLETCHRVEIVTHGDERSPRTEAAEGIAVGDAAIRRVFAVAAGFDSAVIAEEQVLGQVRAAYEAALAAGTTGPILNELFRRALRFGRRVRSHARPGSDRSLADPALAWLRARVDPGAAVLVAGTGVMGRLLATSLASDGHLVTVASQSPERGLRLLEQLPGTGHSLHVGELTVDAVARRSAVVLAARRGRALLARETLGPHRPWTLDLSAPSMVAPDAAERLGERLLDLDRLAALAGAVPGALSPTAERLLRAELEDEVRRFADWLVARNGADAIALLHRQADEIRRRHIDRLRARAHLDDVQLSAVEAATAAMLGELLHGPSVALRRDGPDAGAVRRLFGVGP